MNDILSLLGANGVTQPIKTNQFEETFYKKPASPFVSIINPIEFAGKHAPAPVPKAPLAAAPKAELAQTGVDSLYAVFATILDPTLALFKPPEARSKVQTFKEGIIKSLELKAKSLGLTKNKVTKEGLATDEKHILTYFSRLLNRHVFCQGTLFKGGAGASTSVISIVRGDNDVYSQSEDIPLSECYAKLCAGIDSKLVKEVREIAVLLDINVYDDNKKLLPKKDLLELIKAAKI
jgi:hypothetical protein